MKSDFWFDCFLTIRNGKRERDESIQPAKKTAIGSTQRLKLESTLGGWSALHNKAQGLVGYVDALDILPDDP